MAAVTPISPLDPRVEMFRTTFSDNLFNMKALASRPQSSVTLIYDTEFEDDDGSDIEIDDECYSARVSMNSAGRRSETTLSSFEEIPTPKDPTLQTFDFDLGSKAVKGPRGPHLFRTSTDSSQNDEYILTMSPITPITPMNPRRPETAFKVPPLPYPIPESIQQVRSLAGAMTDFQATDVEKWTPQQVKRWMQTAGIEPAIIEKFEENDISGEVLITLKFEDLRELDIRSLGKRHKLWNAIHNLRGDGAVDRASPTVMDCSSDEENPQRRIKAVRKKNRRARDEMASPLCPGSIVGIEQLIPKRHKCGKGENCSKWRKQQRKIESFKNEHPVSPKGGMILVAGDPGNPLTAEVTRPFSEAQPSVVASSDVLGPTNMPSLEPLRESALANVALRDPQDNVKQFLSYQHMEDWLGAEPGTPPNEMFPPISPSTPATSTSPHPGLQSLPKLAIPGRPLPCPASTVQFSPHPMDRAEALSPDLRNATRSPQNVYRFGTPFSEMDVPVTAVNLGPISREISQSVPPNMSYRNPSNANPIVRSQSRSARRPSFPVLPPLEENAPLANPKTFAPVKSSVVHTADDVNHGGWMKKRKTRMLRHEWHEHHFTLTGTRLAMHKDERDPEVLESIDIDDYAIGCSSLASSKLNAAFKAMNIKLGKEKGKGDDAAFAFQLIPAAIEKGQKLKKKDAAHGSTKTHHFAVKTRDERIDWMRELMLAKAIKQKGEGFEISLNGNMI